MRDDLEQTIAIAAETIGSSKRLIAFTGAGISVESGVPTFRGEGGLWEAMDPSLLQIDRFNADPTASWEAIRELFYKRRPLPNAAHRILAEWERLGILSFIITQNIDGLHSAAGSRNVAEFHGSIRELVCLRCGARVAATAEALDAGLLDSLPPRCSAPAARGAVCGGLLKPDFVFFGEGIPPEAYESALAAAESSDVCLIVGSTGLVYPAAQVPMLAKHAGAKIIEIDPGETEFSSGTSDVHIRLGASAAMIRLDDLVKALRARIA
jgi:NAD-dependent deacetylase